MKSPLLPDTHLFETKPSIYNEGMFVVIGKKGQELLNILDRDTKKQIKNIIKNSMKNNTNHFLYNKIKKIIQHFKKINIKKLNIPKYSAIAENIFLLTIWSEKFFIKTTHDTIRNSYGEAIWLSYLKKEIEEYNIQKDNITIKIIEPIYALYDKKTDFSLIMTPYIKKSKTLMQIRRENDDLISKETVKHIITILWDIKDNIIKTTWEITIQDYLSYQNVLIKNTFLDKLMSYS